jgi:hypothetical protein
LKSSTNAQSKLAVLGGLFAAHLALSAAGCFDDTKDPAPDSSVDDGDAESEPIDTSELDAGFADVDEADLDTLETDIAS